MKRKNVRHQLCIFLSLLLILYSALLPVSAVNLDESTHSTESTLPSSSSRSVPLDAYEGTFFVKNRGVEKFLQTKTNIFADPSVGTKMDLRQFDGGADQKWRFVHVGEGFYKIVPDSVPADSSLCIAVQEGKETTANQDLILDEYHYADGYMRKQWTITPVSDATYIIRPRCGLAAADDFIMAPSTGLLDFREDLQNRVRTGDMGYEDEWYLYYTILDGWHSDGDKVAYWQENPTVFVQNRDVSDIFHFDESVNFAIPQWSSALSIPLQRTTNSSAPISCIGGSVLDYEDKYNISPPTDALGITHAYSYIVAQTFYGSTLKDLKRMYSAEIFIFSTQRVPDEDKNPTDEIYVLNIGLSMQKNVLVHEFGHALGYLGHSRDGNDLMYRKASVDYTLTSADIEHIKQIYDHFR